ncbi:hypothetical protein H9650_13230 [Psychrobacillus sp. Sa2BUA9]|uniref:Uncharacterized protein n=1 Tax=Psychrobacillus faecigallinarum TaxID=2762235 RepID=A0ABR8RC16_9BACI|nr:hypothetical protein [Psychrobacillus faecigallinarum]MBD7945082.1 hypothetical protein [Psychrobacillus faecigallinarum]
MRNIANDIADGTITISKTIRSVFVGTYNKVVGRSKRNLDTSSSVEEKPYLSNPVTFFDWLNEKPSDWESFESKPVYLENWLEW